MRPAPQARDSGYLSSIAESASQTSNGEDRIARFALQAAARELAPASRVRSCLRAIVPGRDSVEIWHSPTRRRAYYVNLITCNRVWVCPVCASKITERRRVELARLLGVRDALEIPAEKGRTKTVMVPRYYLALVTFTISHKEGESLSVVLARLKRAYHKLWSGRWPAAWKSKHRVIGTIRSIEVTHGINGWHPHVHLLLVRDSANTQGSVADMDIDLTLRWQDVVEAVGGNVSLDHGVNLEAADDKGTEYISKMGQQVDAAIKRWDVVAELTKYPAKRGREASRTMWDLLVDYIGGDVRAGELWIEGVAALHGTAHLMASPGLWKALQAPDSVGDDKAMAEESREASDAILASLTVDEWRAVVRKNRRGELLEVASAGDPDKVAEFLRELK